MAFSSDGNIIGSKLTFLLSTALASAALTVPAFAQQESEASIDDAGLDTIFVTATKRGATTLQDTPIALSAFSEQDLLDRNVQEFSDWAFAVPSLSLRDSGPGDKQYIIRGISSRASSPVGVYLDEAVLTANNSTNEGGGRNAEIKLYDIERIEVLNGPQGTLYGANSMAGTVRIVTNAPNLDEFEGFFQGGISYTENGQANYETSGMLNIPLSQINSALRIVGWVEEDGGFIDQIRFGIDNGNDVSAQGVRVRFRSKPTDNLTVDLMGLYQSMNADDVSRFTLNDAPTPPRLGAAPLPGNDPGIPPLPGGDLLNNDFVLQPWEDESIIAGGTIEWNAEMFNVTAASHFFARENLYIFDGAATIFTLGPVGVPGVSTSSFPQSRDLWSNEIRVASKFGGPVNFVFGGYLQDEDADFTVEIVATNNDGERLPFNPDIPGILPNNPFGEINPGGAIFGRTVDSSLNQRAIFGEVTYDITETLQLLAGARYFWSSQTIVERGLVGVFGSPPAPEATTSIKNNQFSPKVTLTFQPNGDLTLYATYAKGFRVGGINQVTPFAAVPATYDPDTLESYELGWKSTLIDGVVTFNGAIYWNDWSDIQVVQADSITGIFNFVANGGEARIRGVEAQLAATPMRGLDLSLSASFVDADIIESQGENPLIPFRLLEGDDVPNVPDFSASFFAQYSWDLGMGDLQAQVNGDVSYVGEASTEGSTRNPFNQIVGDYTLANLRAGISGGDSWTLNLFINNLFDKRAIVDIIADSQTPADITTVRPRTFGANVRFNF